MEDRELAGRRIATPHQRIGGPRQASDLQLQVILVGPEPWHFTVGPGLADHAVGGMLGLVDGILYAFQADFMAFAADMAGAIASRPDMRIASARILVHDNAVGAAKARRFRQLLAGNDADADQ